MLRSRSRPRPRRIWSNMLTRCRNPRATGFKYWGGKGVSVCEKWLTFAGFWEDMADGYADHLSIDRIDGSKGYEPGNCRWATRQMQSNNKADTVMVEAFGERKSLAEWARDARCRVRRKVLWWRLRNGYAPETAISSAPRALPVEAA